MERFLEVKGQFAAAHRLKGYKGQCEMLHGHTWMVDVKLKLGQLDEIGIGIDFKDIKSVLASVLGELDHAVILSDQDTELAQFLRDNKYGRVVLVQVNPTAEILAEVIYKALKAQGLPVVAVKVWESDKAAAEVQV